MSAKPIPLSRPAPSVKLNNLGHLANHVIWPNWPIWPDWPVLPNLKSFFIRPDQPIWSNCPNSLMVQISMLQ